MRPKHNHPILVSNQPSRYFTNKGTAEQLKMDLPKGVLNFKLLWLNIKSFISKPINLFLNKQSKSLWLWRSLPFCGCVLIICVTYVINILFKEGVICYSFWIHFIFRVITLRVPLSIPIDGIVFQYRISLIVYKIAVSRSVFIDCVLLYLITGDESSWDSQVFLIGW